MKHGRLQSMGLKRVRHNGTTNRIFLYFYIKLVIHQVRKMLKQFKEKERRINKDKNKQYFRKCKMSELFFFHFLKYIFNWRILFSTILCQFLPYIKMNQS